MILSFFTLDLILIPDHVARVRERREMSESPGIREAFRLLAEAVDRMEETHQSENGGLSGLGRAVSQPRACSSRGPVHEPTRTSLTSTPFNERRALFRPSPSRPPKKRKKLSIWYHDFVCLARTDQDAPPSSSEKAGLMQAGLGLKTLGLCESDDPELFMKEVVEAYPKLANAGGFELLRTADRNNFALNLIPIPASGYCCPYVKSIAGQAKVYVRPIQQDLSVDIQDSTAVSYM